MAGYLEFLMKSKKSDVCSIFDKDKMLLGRMEKLRVGRWMSWCLFLEPECYLSASCMDEVRDKMKELNATANKK